MKLNRTLGLPLHRDRQSLLRPAGYPSVSLDGCAVIRCNLPLTMANHKVLIVDESSATRERLRTLLPKGNYEIREAPDGDAGLALIEQERRNIRFILLGTELTPPTAWDILGQLRQDRDLYKVPLVLMTPDKPATLSQLNPPPAACELLETPFEKRQLQSAIKARSPRLKTLPQRHHPALRRRLLASPMIPMSPYPD